LDRELDDLLARLRQAPPPDAALEAFDHTLRDLLALHPAGINRAPRLRLSFQVTAVAVAFVIGVVMGGWMPSASHPTQSLLVDVMDP
jgi:hypothetical protein